MSRTSSSDPSSPAPSAPKTDDLEPLILKKDEERRLRAGHLWVFSNEVDIEKTPLTNFKPGQPINILSHRGQKIGSGYVNPHSLICARLVSRLPNAKIDAALLEKHIQQALALRERLFEKPYYRMVFGESDFLPGLIVDRYNDTLVVQITTAGMEQVRETVVAVLEKLLSPSCILLRNDSSIRKMEHLETYIEVASGNLAETILVEENGQKFHIDPKNGQKTGWFYDHRDNRQRMKGYVPGKRVLDLFSYSGGWGIQAATAGASEVFCVDSSERALDECAANAELNGVTDKVATIHGDVFGALKELYQSGERFDVIICDPPAFIKRRKDKKVGQQAYRRLNQMAMQLLNPDSILISASCSYHLAAEDLMTALTGSGRHFDKALQIIEKSGQGRDHPIHPSIPETAYLKTFFTRVLPGR